MKIYFNHKEELWNSWSHGAGVLLGLIVGTVFLVWCGWARNGWATAGIILYLFGMLCSYAASTLYHALSAWSPWKERLRRWDHAAIYWHIAGSYSPITLIALRDYGAWGWALFGFIWAAAIAGTVKSFVGLKGHSRVETLCFVAMGLSVLAQAEGRKTANDARQCGETSAGVFTCFFLTRSELFFLPQSDSKYIYRYLSKISQTAMMWQMEPRRTKKWKTVCM